MNPVQAVSAILKAYRPHFADVDYGLVRQWLDEGCELEADILPVIREWTARKPDIRSLGYFTRYVLAAKAARVAAPAAGDPHRRAKHIAYLTRVLGRRMPTEQRWLAAYEQKNGRVAPTPQIGGNN